MKPSAGIAFAENSKHEPVLRVERNIYASFHHVENVHEYPFPVIRVDEKGRILYANRAAFPLLREWNCMMNCYLPDRLVSQHPGITDPQAQFSLVMEAGNSRYHLDVVGFSEAGYIGLYGFNLQTA